MFHFDAGDGHSDAFFHLGESSLHPWESGALRQATVQPMDYGATCPGSGTIHILSKDVEMNIQIALG